ncbi:MAG: tetratricopeptide repeat protein [Planctomycetaceae bacterium]
MIKLAPFQLTLAFLLTTCCFAQRQQPANGAKESNDPNVMAELAYSQRRFADVLKITEKQIKAKPGDHVAHYLSASALVEIGRKTSNGGGIRQGIEDARKAIELSKGEDSRYFLPYLYGMTSLTEIEGDPQHTQTALATADRVLAKAKTPVDRAHLLYHRGRIHGLLKKPKKSQADFQEAIRQNGELLAAWMGLANVFIDMGNLPRARETYDSATRKFPRDPVVFNNRGLFLQEQDEFELAVADFTRALQLNPRYFAAHTNRGYTLLSIGDPAAAELDFSASLGLYPQQPMVYRLRAGCRLLQKQPVTAIEDLTAAFKLRPDTATHVDLGFAQVMNRDFKAGADLLAKAQRSDPALQHIRPWRFAALIGQKNKAAGTKEFAADIARTKANSKDCVWSDWLCGLLAGAIDRQKLLQIANSDPQKKVGRLTEANFFLGFRAEMSGDVATAKQYYQQSLTGKRVDLAAYRGALIGLDRIK